MVKHAEHIEWRSPEAALALDVSLVEHVFRTLARQRRDANNNNNATESSEANPPSLQDVDQRDEDNQLESNTSDRSLSSPKTPPPALAQPYFHPDMLFSKSDVLVTLERAGGFLQKRPQLRKLHTILACVSLEKEGASVEGFVRYRVKEHTLSFAMARDRLLQIHATTQRAIAFDAQVQHFKTQAQAKSLWCVRDWKSICRSPAQHYNVHVLPVKPKSQKQLDMEQRVREAVAASVVNNVLALSLEKLVAAVQARSRPSTAKRSARGRTPVVLASDASTRKPGTRSDPALRAKARRAREAAETEARRRELRLQLFAPGIETNAHVLGGFGTSGKPHATAKDNASAASNNDVCDDLAIENEQTRATDSRPTNESKRQRLQQRQLLLLATIEANGDVRIAERIATLPIARSGFERTIEQATNLGLASDDVWGLVKIWRSVYRSHTLQSFQSAYGGGTTSE